MKTLWTQQGVNRSHWRGVRPHCMCLGGKSSSFQLGQKGLVTRLG